MSGKATKPLNRDLLRYGASGTLVLLLAWYVARANFLIFHSVVEISAALVSLSLFVIVWNARKVIDNPYLVWVGIALLYAGGFDTLHALTYEHMNGLGRWGGVNASFQLWLSARAIEAFAFLTALRVSKRTFNPVVAVAGYGLVSLVLLETIFNWSLFPILFVPGQGLTSTKITAEYLIALGFGIAAVSLWKAQERFEPKLVYLLITSLVLALFSELSFTLFQSVSGLTTVLGHCFKLFAFYCLYKAVVQEGLKSPYDLLLSQLKQSDRDLEKHRDQLKSLLDHHGRELEFSDEELRRKIEEKQRADRSLKKERTLITEVLNALPIAVYLKDMDGKYVLCNQATERFLGQDSEKIIGFTDQDLLGLAAEPLEKAERELNRTKKPQFFEFKLLNQGEMKTLWRGKRLLYLSDEIEPVMMGFAVDITDRKKAEEALVSAKEIAEAANQAKSNFLSVMSHELRTPLNGILGLTQFLVNEETNLEKKELLEIIQSSGTGLLTLLADILDTRRLEQGRFSLRLAPFEPESLFENLSHLFAASAKAKGLVFVAQILRDIPRLLSDPARINQILSNLLANAIKFTAQGEVQFRVTLAKEESNLLFLRFEVQDTGIGIAPEQQKEIFLPFTQVDTSSTRVFEGVGVGLSLVVELVKMLDGTWGLDSQLGQGSLFWVQIPFVIAPPASQDPHEPKPVLKGGHSGKKRVLIVEDDQVSQIVLNKMMGKCGLESVLVSNGLEAIEAHEQQPFDLILMDWLMPVLDGLSATRRIRDSEAKQNLPAVPILAVTAKLMPADVRLCLNAGVDHVLDKPVRFDELQNLTHQMLTRKT